MHATAAKSNSTNGRTKAETSLDKTRINNAGLRLTGHTKSLLSFLERHPAPITAQDLHRRTRSIGWDLATVYRLLLRLEKAGFVRATVFQGRSRWFDLVGNDAHHHHMFCGRCGRIERLDACALPYLNRKAARGYGFHVFRHTMELFGLCRRCFAKKAASKDGHE